jgi:hypothetical protein
MADQMTNAPPPADRRSEQERIVCSTVLVERETRRGRLYSVLEATILSY